jgi:hypothetical protein
VTKEISRLSATRFEIARHTLGQAFESYPLLAYALPRAEGRLRAVTWLYGTLLRYLETHVE